MVGGFATETSDRRTKAVGGRIDTTTFTALEFGGFFNNLSPFMLVVAGLAAESAARRPRPLGGLRGAALPTLPLG